MKNNHQSLGIIKHSLVFILTVVFALINIGFLVKYSDAKPNIIIPNRTVQFTGDYDWDETINPKTLSTDYISYTDYRANICTQAASSCNTDKIIRFDTAEELYRFSVDVSFDEKYTEAEVKLSDAKIDQILSQHFVLGQDIDYSTMRSKTFIPVGYLFADTLGNIYQRYFKGIFDGQGFEIKNLYMSGYNYLIYEDTNNPETVDIAMTEFYAMFNYNAGVIRNIGFIDLYTELLEMNPDLTKLANIVGLNMPDPDTWNEIEETFSVYGLVENIYVIDNRTNVTEAGIRYLVGNSSEDFQAAGIVHTNAGNFRNSYFVSKVVVNANFIEKFDVQPVVFSNNGSVIVNLGEVNQEVINVIGNSSNLSYDSTVYLTEIDINNDSIPDIVVNEPNVLASGVSTNNLKNGSFSYDMDIWFFYPEDGYPILKGLVYDSENQVYQISSALDLAFFARLLNKNTVLNGVDFPNSDYILTNDIDMSILAPGIYEVPSRIFYGSFSGYNPEGSSLADNFYIYGLEIRKNYSLNNEHFSGLFSRLGSGAVVSSLNFSQSIIRFVNTNRIYASTFYMGAIAGRMIGATVEDVLLDVSFDLGTQAISRTYVGGVAGTASGIIRRVSNSGVINFGTHTFGPAQAVNPRYYLGGIVGSTQLVSPLRVEEAVNNADIYGFSTTSDIVLASGVNDIYVYLGGIIGYIGNSEIAIHSLISVANKGDIHVQQVKERTAVQAYQYVGGVFGILEGLAPILEDETGYLFANLYNEGDVFAEYFDYSGDIKSAGIGISNTTEDTEYALLFNHGTFDYNNQNQNFSGFSFSSDLFISEYSEGSSSNRYIEIYNGTGQTVNLTGVYTLRINTNANTTWSSFSLSGSIAPGATHVVANSSASATIRSYANQTTSTVMNFDGNDAIGLFKNGVLIDIFGIYANNPGAGWTINGIANATQDHTIIRSSTSTEPTTTWVPSDWEVYDNEILSFIKNHRATYQFDYNDFIHTATIMDISNSVTFNKLTLTRVFNFADFSFESNIYSKISPFVYSQYDKEILLRFSENHGDINYMANSGNTQITVESTIELSGVTSNTNVDFLNFHNYGDINVVNLNLKYHELFIAGFSKFLSEDKFIRNSLNDGDIKLAQISGSGNIYVAGFVNINNAGDLHESFQSETQPIANEGIINSINSGNISTVYSTTIHSITGTNNTFVGGLVTLNKGSIQDSTNLGDISLVNTNSGSTNFAASTASSYEGGIVLNYTGGISAGGVSGMVLDGNSRIYDSSNKGNILVMTSRFSRAGGVLGVSLFRESIAGNITQELGLVNNIQDSVLSNGLNLGNISTLTTTIEEYLTGAASRSLTLLVGNNVVFPGGTLDRPVSLSYSDTAGSEQRIAVHASAGGVIGYGLSVMKNMLNHGTISSTDVAGGVVGATYVLGGADSPVTVVNITTAVNYGNIKSILASSISSIQPHGLTMDAVSELYMADGNPFIFPTGYTREAPRSKRGFGGIFGRLQRGNLGAMSSAGGSFDFIVNANPEIDLIGRIDQVADFSNTITAYRFNDAIVYSAKLNDTTQKVFSGFTFNGYLIVSAYNYVRTGTNPYTHTLTINYQYGTYLQRGTLNTLFANGTTGTMNIQIVNSSTLKPADFTTFENNPNRYFLPNTYLSGANQYVYSNLIPWITENPNDSNLTEDWNDPYLDDDARQYIYGPYFPMRTNPNLTEYIYFAEYNLLADRFRSVIDGGTGANVRANGMYVLSTTAGQDFGAVLPRNIRTTAIENINEDLNLAIDLDYSNIAPSQRVHLDQDIIDKYEELYQTRYSDKAELTNSIFQNLTLHENGGSQSVLENPTINYVTREINFAISMEAFDPLQPLASFDVFNVLASSNSLIAIRPDDYFISNPSATLADISALLYDERYDVISTDYPALLDITLPNHDITSNTTLPLGYFSIYSEAFVNDPIFANSNYFNDYLVTITFTPNMVQTPGTIGIQSVAFNGGSNITLGSYINPQPTSIDIRGNGDVNYNGSLRLNFNDGKGILNEGYDFKNNFRLYYMDGTTEVEVDSTFYTVTSVPVNSSGLYQISFDFSNELLKRGDYRLKYSYFVASPIFTVNFDKAASNQAEIDSLNYYSMSTSFSRVGNNFYSSINMGKVPSIDGNTNNFNPINIDPLDPNYRVFLSNTTYDISYMFSNSFVISRFASVTRAQLIDITYSGGYITYVIQYVIVAENNTTSITYTHYITERAVDVVAVLKDGNDVPLDNIYTSREATNTQFSINLGFDQSIDMSGPVSYSLDPMNAQYLSISVTGVDPDGNPYLPGQITGLTYQAANSLLIFMSNQTLPGTYIFSIIYNRGATIGNIIFTAIEIVKEEGVDAYLSDIKFTPIASETKYPEIFITNQYNQVIPQIYDPSVYFFGIDYDGADEDYYQWFKIKGQVNNIPLESYYPYMLEYLPLGATVSRYDDNTDTWTDEVNLYSTDLEKSVLAADFTQEGVGDENVAILYRVTSEDGEQMVYYYITVNDIMYNLTLIFDIYFCDDQDICVLANTTNEFNKVIQVKTINLDIYLNDITYTTPNPDVNNPLYYPEFSKVSGLNNQMSQFIYTDSSNYTYRFGRNRSGFYIFDVVLPYDQYLNQMYTYEIKFGEFTLNDVSDLPPFESRVALEGKYFFIDYSITNRTRRFDIYIRKVEVNPQKPFGLFDIFRTWSWYKWRKIKKKRLAYRKELSH